MEYKYPYRVMYENRHGITYKPQHFYTIDKASKRITAFFAPDNNQAGAPRRGYLYEFTVAVLQERTPDGGWRDVSRHTFKEY